MDLVEKLKLLLLSLKFNLNALVSSQFCDSTRQWLQIESLQDNLLLT